MLFLIFVLIWLLICAWFTIYGLAGDLGLSGRNSVLWLIRCCLFRPIVKLIIEPLEELSYQRKKKKNKGK